MLSKKQATILVTFHVKSHDVKTHFTHAATTHTQPMHAPTPKTLALKNHKEQKVCKRNMITREDSVMQNERAILHVHKYVFCTEVSMYTGVHCAQVALTPGRILRSCGPSACR